MNFAFARSPPLIILLEFTRVHAKGARDRLGVGLESRMAQFHDRERFTRPFFVPLQG